MNFFIVSSYFTGLASAVFAAFVILKNPQGTINKVFFVFAMSVALWAVGIAIEISSSNARVAEVCLRFFHIGVCLIPITFYHFSLCVMQSTTQHKFSLKIGYATAFLFIFFIPSGMFIAGVQQVIQFPYYLKPGPLYHPFMIYFVIFPFIAEVKLFFKQRVFKGNRKRQVQYVFMAGLIGFIGGLTSYLPAYNIEVYPWMNSFVFLYVLIMAASVLKHQLMDIDVFIKKTMVFTGLFSILILTAVSLLVVIQFLTGMILDLRMLAAIAFTVTIAMIVHDPAKSCLTQVTDRYLFQKTLNFKQILTDLSHTIIAVLDIDKIGGIILHTFENALHLESGAILLKTEDGKAYKILDAFGLEKKLEPIDTGDPLVSYFSDSDKVVNLDLDDNVPDFVKKAMSDFRARVMVPLFFQAQLIGILVLGRKKSDQEYTRQEMEYFPAISAQIAVALSNAREIELRKKNQADYYQQSKLAAIGIMASGIAHELKNPLQVIRGCAGLVDSGFKKGFYKTMPYEELSSDASEALKRVFENQPDAVRRGRVRNLLKR